MDITEIWKPQAGPQLMATLCPVRMVLFGGSRGGGKASSNDAKLLTNSGWRYFSEVRVGDKIVDPETGGTQDVLGVFPQGEKDLYSVVMEDGGSTLVTSDHLWTYRSLPSSKLETARTHSLQSCLGEGRKVFLPVYLDFSSSRAVRSIEFSHRGEATCISVSATHGLYVTDDYIVTHNTDCAIGKQIYGAMRYGSDWNGLFIRKNYKYFADIRRRLQQLIRAGLPAELVGPAQGTNYLRFQNGANVTLTVIESLEKAEFFQGQSFCVAEGTRILMADGSGRPIEAVSVGDMVMTLEGPRPVTALMSPYVAECVCAETEMGGQTHPLAHPIFSASGWQSYTSVLGSDSRGTGLSSLGFSAPPVEIGSAVLVPHGHSLGRGLCDAATLSCVFAEFRQRVLLNMGSVFRPILSLTSCLSELLQQPWQQFLGQTLGRFCEPFFYGQRCGHCVLQVQGSLSGCPFLHGYSDGRAHRRPALFQDSLPLSGGAEGRFLDFLRKLWGVLGNTHKHSQTGLPMYEHPYVGDFREIQVQNLLSACEMSPVGERLVYDLTVKDANHYISYDSGLVNKNTCVVIEEACQFGYIDPMIEMLKGCLRSASGVPTSMFLTANPGGSGHSAVRARFMPEGSTPGQIVDDGFGMQSVFIASNVEDNKILCENDPEYVNLLRSIKDPILRRAWLEGDWDVVLGGFFGDVWNKFKHVVPDFRPPGHWPRIVGMDWGSSTPFSIGWYCVADGETSVSLAGVNRVFPKGALIRFHEWYGCPRNSVTGRIEANVGLRMASEDVASRMVDLEQRMPWLLGTTTRIDRIADPSIFAEKDGPSIAEKMAMKGIVWRKGENKRISGWDTMRKLLQGRVISRTYRDMEDGTREVESEQREPMLYFTEGCIHMIRTLPEVERDLLNIEDVDDSGEDHACLSLDTELWFNGSIQRLGDILGQGGQVLNRFGLEEPATGVQITRRNASVVELVFNGSREVCTPDHRWLCVNNEWKEAQSLRPGDLLARNGCGPAKVLGVFPLENKEDVACMYVPRTHSFVLASGLVSRNCDECRYVVMSRPSTGVLLRDTERPGVMTENERDFMEAIQGSNTASMENLSLPRSADTGFGVSSVKGLMLHIAR